MLPSVGAFLLLQCFMDDTGSLCRVVCHLGNGLSECSLFAEMVMDMVLEADSIYYAVDGREILNGAYINCRQGEIVGLLGRNGCGKSTMLEIIFGTRKGSNSFVRIGGKVYTGRAYRSGMLRMKPQFEYIPHGLRVSSLLRMEGFRVDDIRDESIRDMWSFKVGELSGGQLAYLQIFIFLQSATPLVILDEPFVGLSPVSVEHVVDLLREARKNKGIIISDHNYEAISRVSDRLMFMEDGQTREIRSLEDVRGMYW